MVFVFLKVHAPWEVVTTYAEILRLQVPFAESDIEIPKGGKQIKCIATYLEAFEYDHDLLPDEPLYFSTWFSKDREEMFLATEDKNIFTLAYRSEILALILNSSLSQATGTLGIQELIDMGVYNGAFPPHAGEPKPEQTKSGEEPEYNARQLLYEAWGKLSTFYKKQPLDHIALYFGAKIALFFAWLGLYTYMLIPVSIIGVFVFLFQLRHLRTIPELYDSSCDATGAGKYILCPIDQQRPYVRLHAVFCQYPIENVLDNDTAAVFGVIMALWSEAFIKIWRGVQTAKVCEWNLKDCSYDETIRPKFKSLRTMRLNPVTKVKEPYLKSGSKSKRYCISISATLALAMFVIFAYFTLLYLKRSVYNLISVYTESAKEGKSLGRRHIAKLPGMVTGFLNLVFLLSLENLVNAPIAYRLTDYEMHRTQSSWEDSFILKRFLFSLITNYGWFVHLAFVSKNVQYAYPKGAVSAFTDSDSFFGVKGSVCTYDCVEQCVDYLAMLNSTWLCMPLWRIVVMPFLKDRLKRWVRCRKKQKTTDVKKLSQWETDYTLIPIKSMHLYHEYVTEIIYYGGSVAFASIFPFGPLFSLLRAMMELRLNAYSHTVLLQRPVGQRVQDIGIWDRLFRYVSRGAVIANACIIAFTTDFIPRMLYRFNRDGYDNYFDYRLSVFNVSDYAVDTRPKYNIVEQYKDYPEEIVTQCRYFSYREPPEAENAYAYSKEFWWITTARCVFIVCFIILNVFFDIVVGALTKDIPKHAKQHELRARHLAQRGKLHFSVCVT